MLIMPAIDLISGRCVRLLRGDFDAVTAYGDPLEQLAAFAAAGARWVHVVDLDGAKQKRPVQTALIADLARVAGVALQVGGGVREAVDVGALLRVGAARVVVGSAAVRSPHEVRAWIDTFGSERVCCAFDVCAHEDGFEVAVDGWTASGGIGLDEALAFYPPGTLAHALVTDIGRDGALAGPNLTLIAALAAERPDLRVQASGGVSALSDLAALQRAGASAAIVGRALYERRFTLEQALAC